MIHFIRSRIQETTTFYQFIDLVFDGIEYLLRPVLLQIRDYIGNTVKQQVESAFEVLRSSLDSGLDAVRYAELNSAIAETIPEVQAAIDRVGEWFAPTERQSPGALRTIDQIVDIGIEATKHARRGFTPLISKDIEHIDIGSRSVFSEFVDILFTVLDNVYAHSGNRVSPWVKIIIKRTSPHEETSKWGIMVRIESETEEGYYTEAAVSKLDRIRRLMNTGEYKTRANLEGGSGLLKLKRLVSLDSTQTLEFGFMGKEAFFVELHLRPIIVPAA